MARIRLVLVLYFFMAAHKAACQTLSKAFLKVYEDMVEVLLVLEIFLREDQADYKQHQWHQHRDQSKWVEA